jgi:hypothetical protein
MAAALGVFMARVCACFDELSRLILIKPTLVAERLLADA